jgi:hypothetical protein
MKRVRNGAGVPAAMRSLSLGLVIATLTVTSGCYSMHVRSLPSPDADFEFRSTFRILENPLPADSVRPMAATGGISTTVVDQAVPHVMLNNSIINRIVRSNLRQAFEGRGYRMTTAQPDFHVAFYAEAVERVETSDAYYYYSYGYDRYVEKYTVGTVVVDVLDPTTGELLWRGSSEGRVSDEPDEYTSQLGLAISKIVAGFPYSRATPPAVPITAAREGEGQ